MGCSECCGALRAEFALERLAFKHEAAAWSSQFARSWLLRSQPLYLTVRCAFAVVMFAILLWSWIDMAGRDFKFWFIYLTHWTLLVQVVYHCFAAFTTYKVGAQDEAADEGDGADEAAAVKWWVKMTWALHDVAFPASFLVTVLYWLLVFTPPLKSALSVLVHGFNFLVMLADAVLSSQPMYYLHGLYFVFYGVVYIIFTLLFHAGDGTNQDDEKFVYSSLDWASNAGGAAILCVLLLLVAAPLMYLFLWSIVYARARKSLQVVPPRIPLATAKPTEVRE